MNINFSKNNVAKMFLSNSLFAIFSFFLIFFSYYILKPDDFSYLTGLFILEGILIFFDLTIYNYVISKLSKFKRNFDRQKLISFYLKKILIFSILFLLFNLILVKIFYWDRIIINNYYTFYNINLSTFLSLISALIVILRVLINYLKVIFIGNFRQELFANIQIVSSVIKILILILLLAFFRSLESILLSYFFGLIFEFIILALFLNKVIEFKFKFKFNINPPKFPNYLFFFAFSIVAFFNADRVFLSYNSSSNQIGQYNFFRVILSGFFILSMSYYYTLLPDISKFYKIKKIIYNKIYINFKSLNIILIFIILGSFLFAEIIIQDFKIVNFLEIKKIDIFKILVIQTYFVIIGIILYSFQVSSFFIKIPTFINFFLIFISIPLFSIFNIPENATNIAIVYLFLTAAWFFINLYFLNKFFSEIFSKSLIIFLLKNSFQNFFIILSLMLILYFLLYDLSKLLFYLILFFCFLYCLKVSQQILNEK
jgi:O-antigen/teichoic acid export membrane protein